MVEPYLGEIRMVAFNFAPRGWAFCEGQLLPIAQNSALFSLIGTIYGGDGRTTFALPDLRGRFPLGRGQGNGLENRNLGEKGGVEKHSDIVVAEKTGSGHGHSEENMPPYLTVNFIIALQGIFPSRS
jgi:microcystin-dependent protein